MCNYRCVELRSNIPPVDNKMDTDNTGVIKQNQGSEESFNRVSEACQLNLKINSKKPEKNTCDAN